MLIDTHCHLDFEQFDADRPQVLARARRAGVRIVINPGADCVSSQRAVALARQEPDVYAAVGIHPHYAEQATETDIAVCRNLLTDARVVAVGEIGLDWWCRDAPERVPPEAQRRRQEQIFRCFLEAALSCDKPVIVHCRQSAARTVEIIREPRYRRLRGVMHCFSQDRQTMYACVEAGWYISFSANITFKSATALREVARQVPSERLLVETDAPYLAAQAYRGRRNEPAWLPALIEVLAQVRSLSVAELGELTGANACRLFSLPDCCSGLSGDGSGAEAG